MERGAARWQLIEPAFATEATGRWSRPSLADTRSVLNGVLRVLQLSPPRDKLGYRENLFGMVRLGCMKILSQYLP
jgi:hypothetical protein